MTIYYVDGDIGGAGTSPYDTWAKATNNIQLVIDLVAADDTVYCQGHQDVDSVPGATITFDGTTGTFASPIRFIGCDVGTTNEPPEVTDYATGDRYHLDANNAAAPPALADTAMGHVHLINFQFEAAGTGASGLLCNSAVDYWMFVNCRFTGNTVSGVRNAYNFNYAIYKQCMFDLNAVGCHWPDNNSVFIACRFSTNTEHGIEFGGFQAMLGCILEGNSEGGAASVAYGTVVGCTFAEHYETNGYGWDVLAGIFVVMLGCRFTGNYYGIETSATNELFLDYCYFDNDNTDITATSDVRYIPDETMTDNMILAGTDTGYGYETGEYNLDPDQASYFNEPLVVPSS